MEIEKVLLGAVDFLGKQAWQVELQFIGWISSAPREFYHVTFLSIKSKTYRILLLKTSIIYFTCHTLLKVLHWFLIKDSYFSFCWLPWQFCLICKETAISCIIFIMIRLFISNTWYISLFRIAYVIITVWPRIYVIATTMSYFSRH